MPPARHGAAASVVPPRCACRRAATPAFEPTRYAAYSSLPAHSHHHYTRRDSSKSDTSVKCFFIFLYKRALFVVYYAAQRLMRFFAQRARRAARWRRGMPFDVAQQPIRARVPRRPRHAMLSDARRNTREAQARKYLRRRAICR